MTVACLRYATTTRKARSPDAALLAREPEITALRSLLDALDARVASAEKLKAAGRPSPDLQGATIARDAALGLLDDLLEEIAGTPAHTIAGLKLKATLTADVWLDPNLMASICADILSMEGNAHG